MVNITKERTNPLLKSPSLRFQSGILTLKSETWAVSRMHRAVSVRQGGRKTLKNTSIICLYSFLLRFYESDKHWGRRVPIFVPKVEMIFHCLTLNSRGTCLLTFHRLSNRTVLGVNSLRSPGRHDETT